MKLFGTSSALRNFLWMRNVSGSFPPFGRTLSKLQGEELTWGETYFEVSSEVRSAVAEHGPVVGLESAIITHGMPFPTNIETALGIQTIIRQKGVVPATVGVIEGKVKVGLSDDEIEFLGSKAPTRASSPVKVSRRDFPFVMAKRLSGGTTVAGTVIACAKAGIPLFATGGVGGVHRGAEMTFDISCDLREVGRHPVGVVCAGVKSILDIGKTLEYLETEGVSVCVLRKKSPSEGVSGESKVKVKFPSFLTAESEWDSPWTVEDESEAASLLHSALTFQLGSGIIIAVPIPKEEEVSGGVIEGGIGAALEEAKMNGVSGKEITPFLLARLNAATAGESLRANRALMGNNAGVAATIAIQLSKLQRKGRSGTHDLRHAQTHHGDERSRVTTTISQPALNISPLPSGRPVIIGGSSLDIVMAVQEQLHNDGRTHSGRIGTAPGGVGRNVAEALQKLGHDPLLITAIGQDPFGNHLLQNINSTKMDTAGIHFCPNANTAIYSAILSRDGECIYGIGDMVIHDQIQPNLVLSHSDDIKSAAIVVMDANIPPNTMAAVMRLCSEHNVPLVITISSSGHGRYDQMMKSDDAATVATTLFWNILHTFGPSYFQIFSSCSKKVWFEPTEVRKAQRLLEVPRELWPSVSFMSPNLKEVESLLSHNSSSVRDVETIVSESFAQFTGLSLILLTRGKEGFMVAQRHSAPPKEQRSVATFSRPSISSHEVKSVSGAGDCLDAGFISGLLHQMTLEECALTATQCAADSLRSIYAVPLNFTTPKRLSLTN